MRKVAQFQQTEESKVKNFIHSYAMSKGNCAGMQKCLLGKLCSSGARSKAMQIRSSINKLGSMESAVNEITSETQIFSSDLIAEVQGSMESRQDTSPQKNNQNLVFHYTLTETAQHHKHGK